MRRTVRISETGPAFEATELGKAHVPTPAGPRLDSDTVRTPAPTGALGPPTQETGPAATFGAPQDVAFRSQETVPRAMKRLALDFPPGADELIGLTLGGRYVVEAILGQGGMGTVYRVRHEMIGRSFALKVLRRDIVVDDECVQRFIREAKIAAAIRHESLIDVTDFGEVTSADLAALGSLKQPFFVMELLEGRTLADVVHARGRLPAKEVAEIFYEVTQALSVAHERGVIHRDLKPDNVFLLAETAGPSKTTGLHVAVGGQAPDRRPRVKVLDFGVAKLLSGAKLTRKGTVFGTPYYMSPEQASGEEVDGRADQYAVGVVMYEALSGRVPFDDDSHMGVMTKHLFEEPQPIEALLADPTALGAMGPIVMRCLKKRPDARFASMKELARALAAVVGETVRASQPDAVERARPSDPEPPAPVPGRGRGLTVRLADASPAPPEAAPRGPSKTVPLEPAARGSHAPVPAKRSFRTLWLGVAAAISIGALVAVAVGVGRGGATATADSTSANATDTTAPTQAAPATAAANASPSPAASLVRSADTSETASRSSSSARTTTAAPRASATPRPATAPTPAVKGTAVKTGVQRDTW